MKTLTTTLLAAAFGGPLLLTACAPTTPRFDGQFGEAVNLARAQQTLDKDAPVKNAHKGSPGLDGRAAKSAVDNYQKSFKAPEPTPNVFTIGVSGTSQNQ